MAREVASTRRRRPAGNESRTSLPESAVITPPGKTPIGKSPTGKTPAEGNLLRPLSLVPHRLTPAERHRRICDLAYRRAEQRGFTPGSELEDWLDAEREVDAGRY